MQGRVGRRDADCFSFATLGLIYGDLGPGVYLNLKLYVCLKSLIYEVFLLFNRSLSRHGIPLKGGWPFLKKCARAPLFPLELMLADEGGILACC